MTTAETPRVSSDERIMAALAHFFGVFGALIVWATQKDRSRFVKFQSLQALAFGGLVTVVTLVAMLCLLGLMILGTLGAVIASSGPGASPNEVPTIALLTAFSPMSFLCIIPLSLTLALVQSAAAISVATGHDWRYPLIAPRVEAFMSEPAQT